MPSPNLNTRQPFQAKLPKSVHDLSQSDAFTMSTGMILPADWDILNPGETIQIEPKFLGYMQPVVTQAMVDCDVCIDHFFVPLSMIFNYFPSWFAQTNDLLSSSVNTNAVNSHLPVLDDGYFSLGSDEQTTLEKLNSAELPYNDLSLSPNPVAQVFSPSDGFENRARGRSRLMERLGLSPLAPFSNLDPSIFSDFSKEQELPALMDAWRNDYGVNFANVLPWNAFAYQAIYSWFYLDEERERRNVRSYNIDYWFSENYNDGYTTSVIQFNSDFDPFKLHYHRRVLDYFTSTKVNPLISSINQLSDNGLNIQSGTQSDSLNILKSVNNYLGGNYNLFSNANSATLPNSTQATSISSSFSPQVGSYISTAQLRSMFAVEKLLRIQGRASKSYDAQVLAHFGYEVPHDVMHQITHIGSDRGNLGIRNVTNMADTGVSPLGERGGQGQFFVDGKKRKFTAPCHGIYMACVYILPHVRYVGTYDKRNVMFNWTDFYHPEYDNLGMQPMYAYEADTRFIGDSTRVDWQYRYEQFKRRYDKASIAFMRPGWREPITSSMKDTNLWSAWLVSQTPYRSLYTNESYGGFPPLSAFYSTPCDLNAILVNPFQPTMTAAQIYNPWEMFQNDPFICDYYSGLKKISTMSVTGEPSIDGI